MSDARQAELEATIVVLRKKLTDAEAERDRLRVAAGDLLAVIDAAVPDGEVWRLSGHRAVSALRGALPTGEDT